MPRQFPLAAVLAVRQQKEDAEERALGVISAKVAEVRGAIARVEGEVVRHGAQRLAEVSATHSAAHHLAISQRWHMLQETPLDTCLHPCL